VTDNRNVGDVSMKQRELKEREAVENREDDFENELTQVN
jgi:hypothetical protein